MQNQIIQALRSLGITANVRGYKILCIAVALAVEDEDRLLDVQRQIYNPTAEALQCNPQTIERNIRTVIERMWRSNKQRYFDLYGLKSSKPPTASEFIDTLAYGIRSSVEVH